MPIVAEEKKYLQVSVDPKIHYEIKKQALRENITSKELVEKIFSEYMNTRKEAA